MPVAPSRLLQLQLALDVGDQRCDRLGAAARPGVREPQLQQLHGAVRVGAVPRAPLHVRRPVPAPISPTSTTQAASCSGATTRPSHGSPTRRVRRPRRPRREAGRRRPAEGGPRRQGRPLAAVRPGRMPHWHCRDPRDDRERVVRRRFRQRLDQRRDEVDGGRCGSSSPGAALAPEAAEGITGVPAADIVARPGRSGSRGPRVLHVERGRAAQRRDPGRPRDHVLYALTGSLDAPVATLFEAVPSNPVDG